MRQAIILAVAGLTAVAAHAQTPAGDTKRPGYAIQQQGNLTNILVVDPDLQKQAALFQALRAQPAAEDSVIVPWLIRHSAELTPVFTYELSRRLWDQGRYDEAFEWYATGAIRARYDAIRCVDATAPQGVMFLPQAAQNVALGIEGRRAEYGRAGLRALARPDLFTSTVSPWWICSHGIKAVRGALQGQALDQPDWLKPQSEWPELQAKLVAALTRNFEEQGKPQDDPVPLSRKQYPTTEFNVGYLLNMIWLNDSQLVIGQPARGPAVPARLLLWQQGSTPYEIAQPNGMWCVGGNRIAYTVRNDPSRAANQPRRLTMMIGALGSLAEESFEYTGELRYPKLMHSGGISYALTRMPMRQSPYDCRWVRSERLSGPGGGGTWIPLLPGDGFLSFDDADGKPSDRLLYYRSETAAPEALPIPLQGLVPEAIRYFTYRGAYFISPIVERPRTEDAPPACRNVWWFKPGHGTETLCIPTDELDRHGYTYAPTRIGILRVQGTRSTPHGAKPGGFYLTDAAGRTEKIYEGRIFMYAVSPGGCAIAFRTIPTTLKSEPPVTVMTLCEDTPTGRR